MTTTVDGPVTRAAARSGGTDAALLATAAALAERGLVIGSVGNVSVRRGPLIRITPTRVPHAELRTADLVTIDFDGRSVSGMRPPSREWRLHAQIYRARADVHAVVHTHSAHAAAWACLGRALPAHTEDLDYYGVGPVRVAPYAAPGSPALAVGAADTLAASRAVLLERHGVVTAGADLREALVLAELVEHQATIAWLVAGAASPGKPDNDPVANRQ